MRALWQSDWAHLNRVLPTVRYMCRLHFKVSLCRLITPVSKLTLLCSSGLPLGHTLVGCVAPCSELVRRQGLTPSRGSLDEKPFSEVLPPRWVIEQFVATQISLHGGETFANPLYSTQCIVMTNVTELNQSSELALVEC